MKVEQQEQELCTVVVEEVGKIEQVVVEELMNNN